MLSAFLTAIKKVNIFHDSPFLFSCVIYLCTFREARFVLFLKKIVQKEENKSLEHFPSHEKTQIPTKAWFHDKKWLREQFKLYCMIW